MSITAGTCAARGNPGGRGLAKTPKKQQESVPGVSHDCGMRGVVRAWAAGVLVLSTLLACRCESSPGAGGGAAPMARGGATTWNIDGKDYAVQDTYFLVLPEGLQFTIEYEVPPGIDPTQLTDEQAYEVAFPLMKHAYDERLYQRTAVNRVGSGKQDVRRIGVALFVRGMAGSSRGHRVVRSLEDIARRASQ